MEKGATNLKKILKEKNLDAVIITNPVNIFYLTHFRGVLPTEREAILIISSNTATLVTARLYQAEALRFASRDLKIKIAGEHKINQLIKDQLKDAKTVGFEEHDLKFSEFKEFKKLLKGKKLIPIKHLIEDLRITKDAEEIKNIERAQIISQKAFDQIIKTIKVGQTEAEIAERLAKIIKDLGGQGLSFESIIASGKNSAKPHHVTGERQLATNDILLFDFGTKYNNYCADLSRTIFVGRAPDAKKNIYHHIQTSQNMAIAKIGAGLAAKRAHNYANNHFKKHSLNQFFLHSLGHGVGLEVHERPSLSQKSKDTLEEGMVFSVEPGLYFPAWGGIRIEDLVVIQGGKAKMLGKKAEFIEIKA